jgi:hypothetical protein
MNSVPTGIIGGPWGSNRWGTACRGGPEGGLLSEQDDALAPVMDLIADLEALLITIKEAVIPVLVGTAEPTEAAWRARSFLRLADRMLEDMHDLLRSV